MQFYITFLTFWEMEALKAYFDLIENFDKYSIFRKVSSILLGS